MRITPAYTEGTWDGYGPSIDDRIRLAFRSDSVGAMGAPTQTRECGRLHSVPKRAIVGACGTTSLLTIIYGIW
jgi:hypothetical protein